jgi:fucose 4-O-acetylase-like acetyltransferase
MDPFNSKFILNEKRLLWIDYDKGISIILVCYLHSLVILKDYGLNFGAYPLFNYLNIFLFGFRMALFFMISGMLASRSLEKKGLAKYIDNRFNNILYPLLIWGFIKITLQMVMGRFSPHHMSPMGYLYLLIDPRRIMPFWYLHALFCIGALYAFLKVKLKLPAFGQLLLGLILYSVSAYIHIHSLNTGFFSDIFEYYFFFALGDVISDFMFSDKGNYRLTSSGVFFPLLAFFLTVQFFVMRIILNDGKQVGVFYVEYYRPYVYLIQGIVGCAFSISLSFLLQKWRTLTFLRVVGYHSLFVYCMHIIVIGLAGTVCVKMLHIHSVPAMVAIAVSSGVILPIFFYNFCLKYNLWWLYTFRKPERQIEYLKHTRIFSLNLFTLKRVKQAVISNHTYKK